MHVRKLLNSHDLLASYTSVGQANPMVLLVILSLPLRFAERPTESVIGIGSRSL